jgi:hypothetical protein
MVLGDVHAAYPELAPVEIAIAVRKRRLTQTNGLDLGARKHDAGHELLQNLVIEGGPLVPYVDIFIVRHS